MALSADRISAGATDCENFSARSGVLPQARKIEAMAWDRTNHPGASHDTNRLFGEVASLLDLVRFIEKNFGPLNAMMERAGMSEMDIYHRTRDIFLY